MNEATLHYLLFLVVAVLGVRSAEAFKLEASKISAGEVALYTENDSAPYYLVMTGEAASELLSLTSDSQPTDAPELADNESTVQAHWRPFHVCFRRSARQGLATSDTCIMKMNRSAGLIPIPRQSVVFIDAQIGLIARARLSVVSIKQMLNSQNFLQVAFGPEVGNKIADLIQSPERETEDHLDRKRIMKSSKRIMVTRKPDERNYVGSIQMFVDGILILADAKISDDAVLPYNMDPEELYFFPGLRDSLLKTPSLESPYYSAKEVLPLTDAKSKALMIIPNGAEKRQTCFLSTALGQKEIHPDQRFWLERVAGKLRVTEQGGKVAVIAFLLEVEPTLKANGRPNFKENGITLEYICDIDSSFFDRQERPSYTHVFFWHDLFKVFKAAEMKRP